jgi:hypothetical protein
MVSLLSYGVAGQHPEVRRGLQVGIRAVKKRRREEAEAAAAAAEEPELE